MADYPVLFIAGTLIALAQYFLLQEVTALTAGTEIVILLVTVAYFSGFSIGYTLSGRISEPAIIKLIALFFLLHLTFPFSLRLLAGALHEMLPGLAALALLFVTAFAMVSVFSILLPAYIDRRGPASLPALYATELCGTAFGFAVIFGVGAAQAYAVAAIYHVAFAALVGAVFWNMKAALAALALAGVSVFMSSSMDRWSLSYFYERAFGVKDAQTLYSVYSPYQKVDIIEAKSGSRRLYLNGLLFYGSGSLRQFNLYLTRLPVELAAPANTLIIGSGSMESVAYASQKSASVTTVEIDEAVIKGSLAYFTDVNMGGKIPGWRYVVDDGKHFLGSGVEKYDLISVDVPAPFTIQTGLVYSEDFMRLARGRLSPKGVFSISLCGRIDDGGMIATAVAAAVLNTFDGVIIHTPEKSPYSFALAGHKLPFTKEQAARLIGQYGGGTVKIMDKAEAMAAVGGAKPIRWDDPSLPVKASLRRTAKKFFPAEGR
ncbi:MAG: hypothetical protein HZB29_03650 [Nitrospinae bacterium]|nr:hypothetical protein [Nitrospinota bacterium]